MHFVYYIFILALSSANAQILETENVGPASVRISKSSNKNTELYITPSPTANEEPRCGQLYNSEKGYIYYKPFEAVESYERCSWVIGVPSALGYTIDILNLGYPTNFEGSGQELVLTGVSRGPQGPVMTTYIPTSAGNLNVSDANIVIVTFYSPMLSGSPSRGFALHYETIFTGRANGTSEKSSHHFIQSPTFEMKYPVSDSSYAHLELTTFLFLPNNNVFSSGQARVWYRKSGLEAGCLDALYIYTLDVTGSASDGGIWSPNGRICADVTTSSIPNDDITLIIFQSDPGVSGTGFWFSFTEC